uniref:glycine cleavage system protein R n=1 Tax=Thaumasiovibrio occultus TaxID=1891184 RepID=UPI000B3637C3|nr:ACT domain-containing protein [Thaumasiovibrio occultus]
MEQFLVITAMGQDRPGICDEVVRLVSQCECNIVDSRIGGFGCEFTLIMLLSGSQSAITQVETRLPLLAQQHDLITLLKRTRRYEPINCDYNADFNISVEDRTGLIEKFTHFLATRQIDLTALSANTRNYDDTPPMLEIFISSRLPDGCHIIELQEAFQALCESLDAKGTINFSQNNQ